MARGDRLETVLSFLQFASQDTVPIRSKRAIIPCEPACIETRG